MKKKKSISKSNQTGLIFLAVAAVAGLIIGLIATSKQPKKENASELSIPTQLNPQNAQDLQLNID